MRSTCRVRGAATRDARRRSSRAVDRLSASTAQRLAEHLAVDVQLTSFTLECAADASVDRVLGAIASNRALRVCRLLSVGE